MLARYAVEHFAQSLDLGRQVKRVVANEEAPVMRKVGVGQRIDGLVVIVSDYVVTRDASAGDGQHGEVG